MVINFFYTQINKNLCILINIILKLKIRKVTTLIKIFVKIVTSSHNFLLGVRKIFKCTKNIY